MAHLVRLICFKGDLKKLGVDGFLLLQGGCIHTLPTHIYVQTQCKNGFCIEGTLKYTIKIKTNVPIKTNDTDAHRY